LVRAHAGWALARLGAREAVHAQLAREADAEARADLAHSLIDQS
jgi:hypothetical protein